jgi:hypothetical protein
MEEMEDVTGMKVMTGIKGMKNTVRKERQHYNAGYMRLNWVWIKEAAK